MRKIILLMAALSITLLMGCVAPMQATWKTLPEIKQMKYDDAWAALVGCITGKNYNLEMSDAAAGYLRTAYGNTGNGTKTRVIVRVISKNPLQITLKAEVIKHDPWNGGWHEVGNNVALENVIIDELTARLK